MLRVTDTSEETADSGTETDAPYEGTVQDRNVELRSLYTELDTKRKEAIEAGNERLASRFEARMRNEVGGEFYQNNRGLAFSVAKMFFAAGDHNAEDYLQDATLGLWEAFTKWDPNRGTFGTFSRTYIAGKTQRGVRVMEYTTISHSDFTARKHVLKKVHELEAQLDRNPSNQEVATATGYTLALVDRVRQGKSVSLETPIGDGNATLGDKVAERAGSNAIAFADEATWWDHLKKVSSGLPPDQLLVLARREGWDGAWKQSLVEIAALTGEGRGTVSRKEAEARKNLTGPCPSPLV